MKWRPMIEKDILWAKSKGCLLKVHPLGQWFIEKPEGHILAQGKEKTEDEAIVKAIETFRTIAPEKKQNPNIPGTTLV